MVKTSFNKTQIKFLLLEGIHARAMTLLKEDGYTLIENYSTALSTENLITQIKSAHFLGLRSNTKINEAVIAAASRLVGIGCFCIGTNQVDLNAAAERGIPVFNAPFANTRSVAELVLGEIILLMRGIPEKNAAAHRGEWLKNAKGAVEIRGKKLGIIGYGHIGTQLGILAENLGMQVYFYDIEHKLSLGNATAVASLSQLLGLADVVTLHVPETALTENLIDADRLQQMKPGSILINASRGRVVDIEALSMALKTQHLKGAAIDVFPQEPKSADEPFRSPLQSFDNVLLTPHIGGSTAEAQQNIAEEVILKLIRYSNQGTTATAVNFPEVTLPERTGHGSRLLHIHHNVPGVLKQLNEIFAKLNMNIAGQYLQTNNQIGYVVIDVDEVVQPDLLLPLQQITGTIRTRLLY